MRLRTAWPSLALIALVVAACSTDLPTESAAAPETAAFSKGGQNANRVDICHVNGQGVFKKITIASAAYGSHIAHGDADIGDAVPDVAGHVFDADCQPVAVAVAFVTTWDTSLGSGTTVTLPLGGAVNADVDWGDGTTTHVTGPSTHDFGEDGIYTVSVTGSATSYGHTGPRGQVAADVEKLVSVEAWGDLGLTSLRGAFNGAVNLTAVPPTLDGAEDVTDMRSMFRLAASFDQDVGGWNTENVTDMSVMFAQATAFNQDIGGWNTGSVTTMASIFAQATAFNQDIGGWNTANVANMSGMFVRATAFNQDIGGWNTANVGAMQTMFLEATSFNQDLSGWCVTLITFEPFNFAPGATWPQPVWGTCPS